MFQGLIVVAGLMSLLNPLHLLSLQDSLLREGKLLRQIQNLTEINVQLSNKVKYFVHYELAPLSGSFLVLKGATNKLNHIVLGGGDGAQVEISAAAAV